MSDRVVVRFPGALFAVALLGLAALVSRPLIGQEKPAVLPPDHAARMAKGLEMFRSDVASLLKQHCLACHGGEKTKGDFSLATRESLLKGGHSGPAVVPFRSEESLLQTLVSHRDEPKMPDGRPKLPDAVIARFAAWIDHGAPYEKPLIENLPPTRDPKRIRDEDRRWWAFQPLNDSPPPSIAVPPEASAVDRFLLAKGAEKKLGLAPAAEKRVLIRRASLDLLGLPPTPEEVAAFLQDDSSEAWPRLVERLLQSPHYGERWARHWLDVARFAESAGFEHDYDRPGAWAFRDFVIKALNADMPYDQFVRWQLAGDEFAPNDPLALSATGFLGAGVFPTQITANEVERTRYDALDDMLSTTGSAFLGLTIGCARCHDHKFDPIPTYDYYRLLATFTTTVRSNVEVELDPEKSRSAREQWEAAGAPLREELAQYEASLRKRFPEWLAEGAASPAASWMVLDLSEIKSQEGATFQKQPDGSYLAQGKNPDRDEYTLTATTALRNLTGLRLEALADPSLVRGGPGRAGNGNFGLSRITVEAGPAGGPLAPVKLSKAEATFQQNANSLSIAASLDDNPQSGWAVDPQFGKDHAAVFTFAAPLDFPAGTKLVIRLDFKINTQHTIGRPRLSVISGTTPSLSGEAIPAPVAELLKQLQDPAKPLSESQQSTLFDWWKRRDAGWRSREAKLAEHAAKQPKSLTTILMCGEGYKPMRHHSQGADFFNETHFLERGSTDRKQGVASQGFLQVLSRASDAEKHWTWQPPAGAKYSGRRRALANWLCDVEQGAGALAARVMVNRLWQHHFGEGLVSTPNDFGRTGASPTQPELLDWLAGELIRGGWKLKPIHKLLLTSAAYRQTTARDPQREAADPNNSLFLRRLPRRLEAEALRDCLLAVSGKLDRTPFGPGVKDERSPRRSVYFTMKRSQLVGSMVVFDQPEPLVSQGFRPTTTVAPQALLLLNGPQVRDWSAAFAARVAADAPGVKEFPPAVARTYEIALGRGPTEEESRDAVAFLEAQSARYAAAGKPDARSLALTDFCQVVFGSNEFAYEE